MAVSTTEWADGFVRDSNEEAGRKLPAKEITQLAQRHLVQEFERVMQAAGFPADARQVQPHSATGIHPLHALRPSLANICRRSTAMTPCLAK